MRTLYMKCLLMFLIFLNLLETNLDIFKLDIKYVLSHDTPFKNVIYELHIFGH